MINEVDVPGHPDRAITYGFSVSLPNSQDSFLRLRDARGGTVEIDVEHQLKDFFGAIVKLLGVDKVTRVLTT